MPRISNVVQVFVASPSDVQEERDILEALLAEQNRIWSQTLGVTFELLRWETHTYPAFGLDPQAIINEQIGDTYDVFIGIIWARFGTPTPRSKSGTMEEFERALGKRNQGHDTPDVMVYFKDTPLPPSKIDPDQLRLVSEFRKSLAELGGLYSVFSDAAGFQASLRAHVAALARKFSLRLSGAKVVTEASPAIESSEDSEDLGFLDYIEMSESRMAEFTSALYVIGEATEKLGNQINSRTDEIREAVKLGGDIKSARNVLRVTAEDIESYAGILRANLPSMSSSRAAAMNALANALVVYQEFSRSDSRELLELRARLINLRGMSERSGITLSGFRTSVSEVPRMISELNKAKKAVASQLGLITSEIENLGDNIENIVGSIDKMLEY